MTWSAEQYVRFERERNRPIEDLLGRISTVDVGSALDVGCGPGNSTSLLKNKFPGAEVVGVDSSENMIAAARKRLPELSFEVADIANGIPPGNFDVILANAVMQWVPNHAKVLREFVDRLRTGGTLAVQIPDNWDEPAHRIMREVAAEAPWSATLAGASDSNAHRHTAEWYYETLRPWGVQIQIWRTTYFHELADGERGVVEWFKGSALRPYLDRLGESLDERFLERYERAIAGAYSKLSGGTVLLPFPRLFIVATR